MSAPSVYFKMRHQADRAALVAAQGYEQNQFRGPDGVRFGLILDILAGRTLDTHDYESFDGKCRLCGLSPDDMAHPLRKDDCGRPI